MKFKYGVVSRNGVKRYGIIDTITIERAIELLQEHKLIIISIHPVDSFFSIEKILSKVKRVNNKKKVVFFKELSILLGASIPLLESLKIKYDQEQNIYFRDNLLKVIKMVEDGSTFSDAMAECPSIFSEFAVNIVKAGEVSGKMQETLLSLSSYIERQYLLNSKVKSALMYPTIVITGFVVIGILVMIFVVPQLTSIFDAADAQLPFLTRALIFSSGFLKQYALLLILFVIIGSNLLGKYLKTYTGKAKLDSILLKLPGFGPMFKKFYLSRFSENFSLLVRSGIPIISALTIVGDVVGNNVYREVIRGSIDEVKIGGSIAYTFENSEQVPSMVSKMIRIGEKTGKLESVLDDLSRFYAKEVDVAVDGITTIIEPILIFALGAGVGLLVAAVLLPIYQMTEII